MRYVLIFIIGVLGLVLFAIPAHAYPPCNPGRTESLDYGFKAQANYLDFHAYRAGQGITEFAASIMVNAPYTGIYSDGASESFIDLYYQQRHIQAGVHKSIKHPGNGSQQPFIRTWDVNGLSHSYYTNGDPNDGTIIPSPGTWNDQEYHTMRILYNAAADWWSVYIENSPWYGGPLNSGNLADKRLYFAAYTEQTRFNPNAQFGGTRTTPIFVGVGANMQYGGSYHNFDGSQDGFSVLHPEIAGYASFSDFNTAEYWDKKC